jgi:hypothetical protein
MNVLCLFRFVHAHIRESAAMSLMKPHLYSSLAKVSMVLAGVPANWLPFVKFGIWRPGHYGSTRNGTLLESVPLGVTTWTVPVVEPAGTVVAIWEFEITWKTAAVLLKLALVVPVRSVPRISTLFHRDPAYADGLGCLSNSDHQVDSGRCVCRDRDG